MSTQKTDLAIQSLNVTVDSLRHVMDSLRTTDATRLDSLSSAVKLLQSTLSSDTLLTHAERFYSDKFASLLDVSTWWLTILGILIGFLGAVLGIGLPLMQSLKARELKKSTKKAIQELDTLKEKLPTIQEQASSLETEFIEFKKKSDEVGKKLEEQGAKTQWSLDTWAADNNRIYGKILLRLPEPEYEQALVHFCDSIYFTALASNNVDAALCNQLTGVKEFEGIANTKDKDYYALTVGTLEKSLKRLENAASSFFIEAAIKYITRSKPRVHHKSTR